MFSRSLNSCCSFECLQPIHLFHKEQHPKMYRVQQIESRKQLLHSSLAILVLCTSTAFSAFLTIAQDWRWVSSSFRLQVSGRTGEQLLPQLLTLCVDSSRPGAAPCMHPYQFFLPEHVSNLPSSFGRPFRHTCHSFQIRVLCNLINILLTPSSRLIMKTLNKVGS